MERMFNPPHPGEALKEARDGTTHRSLARPRPRRSRRTLAGAANGLRPVGRPTAASAESYASARVAGGVRF